MADGGAAGTLGLYLHIPFCDGGKCPYCDFYSVPFGGAAESRYLRALRDEIGRASARARGHTVDTVYFGGGTPSLLRLTLADILLYIRKLFSVAKDAEITFEANPSPAVFGDSSWLPALRRAGFSRLSLGLQSAEPSELAALGRKHSPEDAAYAVKSARKAGFDNLSLDLMLATPGQTIESLRRSVDFASSLSPEHLSAYLLKIEPGTAFYRRKASLCLPDDDGQASFYLAACEAIEKAGLAQYEISNFALEGFRSRHNLKYWDRDEYLGFGPGAHSFFEGRRFYNPPDLSRYLEGAAPADEEDGAGQPPDDRLSPCEEYIMLRLRLTDGLDEATLTRRFGADFSRFSPSKIASLSAAGYLEAGNGVIRLTRQGFLVSNAVIAELLF